MKQRVAACLAGALILGSLAAWWMFAERSRSLRGAALQTIERFATHLATGDQAAALDDLVIPIALRTRTPAEQFDFLSKVLRDEISPEGLTALRRDGAFGPLTNLFPAEAEQWAAQAGVAPGDCLAFRLDRRDGLRTEVVLAPDSPMSSPHSAFKIVRLNNVKQLTVPNISTTDARR